VPLSWCIPPSPFPSPQRGEGKDRKEGILLPFLFSSPLGEKKDEGKYL